MFSSLKKTVTAIASLAVIGGVAFSIDYNRTDDNGLNQRTEVQAELIKTGDVYNTTPGHTAGVDGTRTRIWVDPGTLEISEGVFVLNVADTLFKHSGFVEAKTDVSYFYYDLEIETLIGNTVSFIKLDNAMENILVSSNSLVYAAGNSSSLFKITAVDESASTLALSVAPTGPLNASFLVKVLEGYLTCSDDLNNGYPAFGNIKSTFFENDDVNADPLSDVSITDYAVEGASYEDPRGAGVSVNALVKYQALKNRFESIQEPQPAAINSQPTQFKTVQYIIIGVASLISFALFGLFTFRRKYSK